MPSIVISGASEVSGNLTTSVATYTTRLDEVSATITYVGEADPDTLTSEALWRIKRLDTTNDDLVILWADGDANFDNIWDDRASLTYS